MFSRNVGGQQNHVAPRTGDFVSIIAKMIMSKAIPNIPNASFSNKAYNQGIHSSSLTYETLLFIRLILEVPLSDPPKDACNGQGNEERCERGFEISGHGSG
jgi:hypothetical protein